MKIGAIVIVAILSIPAIALGQASGSAQYLNYEYKGVTPSSTLPNGVKHMGGGLIGDYDADPVYGISQVEKGKTKMLWLERSTRKDATGVTGWKVLDVISFPAITVNDHIFFVGDPAINCRRDGSDIPNLVGVGRINRRQGTFRPSKLWVANLAVVKFEPVPVPGVRCEYSEP